VKVAFVVPYPEGKAPSQRFRFEQQFENFQEKNIDYTVFSFLTEKDFEQLYKPKRYFSKVFSILKGFFKRFLMLFSLKKFEFVFIHREVSPIGPPIFEWIIAKVLKKKIIYDFDDAIWLPNTSEANKIVAKIKWHSKVKNICTWSYKISCGNDYLAAFASSFNKNVFVVPTTVDTEKIHNQTKDQKTKEIIVGWTGTHSTIAYLYEFEDILHNIQEKIPFVFQVISNKDPKFKTLKYKYIAWQKETEIEDLLKFNIGIMPLKNDKWAEGKCGFKAIQYMSLGIPALVSSVGVNTKIVANNLNGFVCNKMEEWENALEILLQNEEVRTSFGKNAQEKIENEYSKQAVLEKYLFLFDFTA